MSKAIIYLLKEEQINAIANLKWQITKAGFQIKDNAVLVHIEYIEEVTIKGPTKKMLTI